MRLAAIKKARALTMVEIDEFNLGGKVRLADCVAPLVSRYNFLSYPKEPKDFDLSNKGTRFEGGKAGAITIEALAIYDGAIYVDTLSSTDDSQAILMEILAWARDEFGLSYSPAMLNKWGYVSQILFYTDFPLLVEMSKPIQNLAAKTSVVMESLWGGLKYEPTNISIGHNPLDRQHQIASLFIQHRINSRFDENKYFSEGPLPTRLHIQFLEEFEAEVRNLRDEG